MRDSFLPFALPLIEDDEIAEVVDSLKSGWITTGPKTHEFAERFAERTGVTYAVPVNSCTAALHLSLLALDIGAGDEVITSPYTFASTANTVIHAGATPVFADIQRDTFNIDPKEIEKKITDRTKAVTVVHYAGHPCDMDEIMAIAGKHGLKVIEDAAHAPFALYKGKTVGAIGDAGCFSFYATKNLTTAEGGMLTTNDKELAERAQVLSLHGLSKDAWTRYSAAGSWFYEVIHPGFKYNMTDIQAALGLHQLEKFDAMQRRREEIVAIYDKAFGDMDSIETIGRRDYVKHVWHLYPILVDPSVMERGKFIEEMKDRNIGTSVHFIPLHLHPYYRDTYGLKPEDYPVALEVYERLVSLPLHPKMTEQDVKDVVEAVNDILGS